MPINLLDHVRFKGRRPRPARSDRHTATAPVRAILLSAGRGTRLGELTRDQPKCMLPFGGRPLLDWQLEALHACGIDDIIVITGFGAARVARHLAEEPTVKTFYNPFYQVADNLASLWLARDFMDRDFLVLNGDTLIAPEVVRKVLDEATSPISVTITRKNVYDQDDMKVTLAGDRVRAIGKRLSPEQTDAESIGLLSFKREGVDKFRQAIELAMSDPTGIENWYLSVVDILARQSDVGIVEIAQGLSAEVDYPHDLAAATALTNRWQPTVARIA